jgi:RHS repeat-associated protein
VDERQDFRAIFRLGIGPFPHRAGRMGNVPSVPFHSFHSVSFPSQNEAMFTGDTQDVIAGMYDTPSRELQGSQQARFLSPDPAGAGWNQYAYPTNPNSLSDPLGLGPLDCVSGESDPSVSGGCQEYTGEYNGPGGGYGGPQFGSGPPDDWGAEWEQEALGAYVSWVSAIEQAGGSVDISPVNGRAYSIDWSVAGGAAYVAPNGEILDASDIEELGLTPLGAVDTPDYSLGNPGNNGKKGCPAFSRTGNATYYNLPGGKTASGALFNPNTMNAAMYQPGVVNMGDVMNVTLVNNPSASVTVTVNDTGPFQRGRDGRALHPLRSDPNGLIDLTPLAFTDLNGSLNAGRVKVTVTRTGCGG